jgi:hypothetical protein
MHIINFLLHIASFQVLANAIANPNQPSSPTWLYPVVRDTNDEYFTEFEFKHATRMSAKEFTDDIKSEINKCFSDNNLAIGQLVVSPTYLRLPRDTFNGFHAAIDRLGKNTSWHITGLCKIVWSSFIPQDAMDALRDVSRLNQPIPDEKQVTKDLKAWVAQLFDRCMTMAWSQLLDADSIAIELSDGPNAASDYNFQLAGLKPGLKIPIYNMGKGQFKATPPQIINTGKSYQIQIQG